MKPYYNENIEEYLVSPRADYAGRECITVDLNQTYQPLDKYAKGNLDKAEFNIRERFGHLQADEFPEQVF